MIRVLGHKLIFLFDNRPSEDYIEWVYKCNMCGFTFMRYFNERQDPYMKIGLSEYYKVSKIEKSSTENLYAVYRLVIPSKLTCNEEQIKILLE